MVLGTVTAVGAISVAVTSGPAIAVAVGVGSTASATVGGSTVAVAAVTPSIGTAISGFAGHVISSNAAPLITAGPIGWITLGCDNRSWDCWKAVLRDDSPEPSNGRLLREVVEDERVKDIFLAKTEEGRPQLILKNKWEECFVIDTVMVDRQIAAHATRF